jgi:pyrimidine operon attenuation protein/uracil phosphoribosyltransferase
MSAPDAMRCFETLVTRMEGALAVDAWLLGLGDEGALLAERLAARLPGRNPYAALNLDALKQGVLRAIPETSPLLQGEGWGGDGVSAPFSKGVSAKPTGVCRSQEERGRKSDTTIVLVDAVLWHGETVVQAVSLLRQHGVYAPIELAVLVDRGGYLVPIAPTYCGGDIIVAEDTVLRLVAEGEVLRFLELTAVAS